MALTLSCTNREKIRISAQPDGPLNGPLQATLTAGDGSLEAIDALSFYVVSGPGAGTSEYSVTDGVLSDTISLSVSLAAATTLGLSADSPVAK